MKENRCYFVLKIYHKDVCILIYVQNIWGCHDHMVVRYTSTLSISRYHQYYCQIDQVTLMSRCTWCEFTCGISVVFSEYYCRRFLCHDLTEILLKVALHSHYLSQTIKYFICYFVDESKYFILKTAKQTHSNKKGL